MPNYKFSPARLVTLTTDAQIKAYVHQTRMTLCRLLAREQRTVSGVAKELGVHPANLTHHFKLLEKTGLIRLVEKRDTGKNLEKYYRAIAFNFLVKPDAEAQIDKKALALSFLRDDLSLALETIDETPALECTALLASARLNSDDVADFTGGLRALVDQFRKRNSPEGSRYSLNVSLYPHELPGEPDPETELLF